MGQMNEHHMSALYCPLLIKLPLAEYTINMSYAEILDETYMDITHVHDSFEICFCLEGTLVINTGGRLYTLLPGDFLLIMPGVGHISIYNPAVRNKRFIMIFDFPHIDEQNEKARPLSTQLDKLSRLELVVRGTRPVDEIIAICGKMEKELQEKDTGWLFLFRGYCLEFLLKCLREVIGVTHEAPKEADNHNLAIEISKYIQSSYEEKLTLSAIASDFHISPRHAQRIFKDYFGVSFTKSLNLCRINHAKSYLVNTDLSINEIAERVGLSSEQTLYRLFREQENMSINEYRKSQKIGAAKRDSGI